MRRLTISGHVTSGGWDLLEKGFPEEAVGQFQACLSKDVMFTPAWQALADAYQRLGKEKESRKAGKKQGIFKATSGEGRLNPKPEKSFWEERKNIGEASVGRKNLACFGDSNVISGEGTDHGGSKSGKTGGGR